jgi:hypothetical protein
MDLPPETLTTRPESVSKIFFKNINIVASVRMVLIWAVRRETSYPEILILAKQTTDSIAS